MRTPGMKVVDCGRAGCALVCRWRDRAVAVYRLVVHERNKTVRTEKADDALKRAALKALRES